MVKRINISNRIDTITNIKMEAVTTITATTITIIEITPTSNTTITIIMLCNSSIKCGHHNKIKLHLIA